VGNDEMRLNCLQLSPKRSVSINFYLSKTLRTLGLGGLLCLATLQAGSAQDTVSSRAPTTDATPAASTDTQSSTPTPLPEDSQTPNTSQSAYTPLIPQQQANPYAPYPTSAITTSGAQAPQITSPSLYTTGTNDLSQIGTNTAILQAFSQQASSGFMSDQAIDYSHGPIERLRLGPFDLKAALVTTAVYDDNLRSDESASNSTTGTQQNQGKKADTSFGITPAILLEYGTHEGQRGYASLVYTPTITRYIHQSDQDSDDQNVAFNVLYPFQRLTLNFSAVYSQVSGINQDLNTRTTQTSTSVTAGGNYDIDDKLSFSASVQQVSTTFSDGGSNSQGNVQGQGDSVSSITTSLNYRLSDKISVGPSFNAGFDKPDNAKQETFEQGLVGITYQPTQKISLYAQGGVEFRQGGGDVDGFSSGYDNQGGDETNPIFSAGLGYTPFDSTSLQLSASQTVHSSAAVAGQNVTSSGVSVSATQRFFQRFFLNLSYNYSHSDDSTGGNSGNISTYSGGSEDTSAYRTSLSVAPTAWTSVSIYYQYLDNKADTQGGTYHDNQMGISASVQF
jgi:hypothetical protein